MNRSNALHDSNAKQIGATNLFASESVVWLWVSIVFIVYVVRFFHLISRYAVNIFFADQWDFNNATLFEKHSLWQMFRWQHGPHRHGVGPLRQPALTDNTY